MGVNQSQNPSDPPRNKAEDFVHFGAKLFKATHSKPMSEKVEEELILHGEPAEICTAVHSGFTARFLRYKTDRRVFLNTLVISSSSIKLPNGINLGDSPQKVIAQLGQPTRAA